MDPVVAALIELSAKIRHNAPSIQVNFSTEMPRVVKRCTLHIIFEKENQDIRIFHHIPIELRETTMLIFYKYFPRNFKWNGANYSPMYITKNTRSCKYFPNLICYEQFERDLGGGDYSSNEGRQ